METKLCCGTKIILGFIPRQRKTVAITVVVLLLPEINIERKKKKKLLN